MGCPSKHHVTRVLLMLTPTSSKYADTLLGTKLVLLFPSVDKILNIVCDAIIGELI